MSFNKKFFTTGGIVASTPPAAAAFDPLQNFETVTYTGNGGTQKITGYIRKGAAFNGSSSYIDLNGSVISVGSFSISLWVNWNDVTNQSRAIHLGNGDASSNISIFALSGNAIVRFKDSGSNYRDVSFSVSTNQWYHISMTYDISNNNYKVYLNGTQQGSTIVASGFTTLANYGAIGARIGSTGTTFPMRGKIDQVRIFDTALNSTQVGELADETYADLKKSTTDYFGDGHGVALYELDEDANDTGSYAYGTGDIDAGQSAVFNGSSSKIDLPSTIVNSIKANNSFTISAWFNTSTTGTRKMIFSSFDGTYIMLEVTTGNQLKGTVSNSSGTNTDLTISTTVTDGDWHHALFTGENGDLKLYLDNGLTQTSTSWNGTFFNGAGGTDIGSRVGNDYFNGEIDQVRIYSSALSASDVEALVSETNVPTANLVAHYKLDGDATDETTNYDGTWSGTEAYSDPAEFPLVQYNGTPTNVNFLGMAFQPDFVWLKDRGVSYHHILQDSVRGVNSKLASDGTYEENNSAELSLSYGQVTSFDSNGFTLGNGTVQTNTNGNSYVAWCWKAGGAAVSNTDGDITSQVSANPDAGFSIVKYTGNGTAGSTIGHGLSSAPEMIIVKNLDITSHWRFGSNDLGWTKYMNISTNAEAFTSNIFWNDTAPTSTVFEVGSNSSVIGNGNDIIAYCFHSVDGYQKVGSYTGNGSATGPIVTLGFRPRFLLVKASSIGGNWNIHDSIRDTGDDNIDKFLIANTSNAEGDTSAARFIFNDNGFQVGTSDVSRNSNGETYIYLAIA